MYMCVVVCTGRVGWEVQAACVMCVPSIVCLKSVACVLYGTYSMYLVCICVCIRGSSMSSMCAKCVCDNSQKKCGIVPMQSICSMWLCVGEQHLSVTRCSTCIVACSVCQVGACLRWSYGYH